MIHLTAAEATMLRKPVRRQGLKLCCAKRQHHLTADSLEVLPPLILPGRALMRERGMTSLKRRHAKAALLMSQASQLHTP